MQVLNETIKVSFATSDSTSWTWKDCLVSDTSACCISSNTSFMEMKSITYISRFVILFLSLVDTERNQINSFTSHFSGFIRFHFGLFESLDISSTSVVHHFYSMVTWRPRRQRNKQMRPCSMSLPYACVKYVLAVTELVKLTRHVMCQMHACSMSLPLPYSS